MEKYIMPTRIVASDLAKETEKLLIDKPLQANFSVEDCAYIENGGFVLLDFGKELNGGMIMTVQQLNCKSQTGKCRVTFGESVMESLSSIGDHNATNSHAIRDTILDIARMSNCRFGTTGFRFVKLQAVDCGIYLKVVKAEPDIKNVEYKGSFECNDVLLNQIWQTGAYTVHLNMHDMIWDGAKRDRLVWIGDMHPEVSTVRAVFGADDSVPASLDFMKNSFPPEKWMNHIASYSMWWIVLQYDWFMTYGNTKYLGEQMDYLKRLTDHILSWIDSGMKTEGTSEFVKEQFVDWSSKDTPSEIEGLKAVCCIALECAAKIFLQFNEKAYADNCFKYANGFRNRVEIDDLNKRVAALLILADIPSNKALDLLAGNSAEEMSCFFGYYVLLAKAKLGDYTDALDIIRTYWGGMIAMGATTFWEDFDIKWLDNAGRIDEIGPRDRVDIHGGYGKYCYEGFRHSLCHGWASGPTAYLSQYVLGIRILEPGCKKVTIKPHLGDLEWVKGSYPTPYGNILVEHRMEKGKLISKVNAPKGIEIV